MAKRSYSWDLKAEVVATYEVDGPAATARLYGVPLQTVKSWAMRLGIHTDSVTKTEAIEAACLTQKQLREQIRVKCLQRAAEMLERMGEKWPTVIGKDYTVKYVDLPHPPASVCKDLGLTFAILLDKYRLEVGEATGREEVRHEYANRPDEDLIREAEQILSDAAHRG